MKKKIAYAVNVTIACLCGLMFGFTALGFFYSMISKQVIGSRDFVVYWATGQQLARHANPYDRDALLKIERAAGLPAKIGAMYMRNPPSTLPMVYPLGFLGIQAATIIWSLALLACLLISVYLVWILLGRPKGIRYWLGLSFGPAMVCLINGQSSLFALLGLTLFLRLHRTQPFWAGVALWLCALKPHLFLPFGVVLLLWIVLTRTYKILLGGALALAASCAVSWWMDPLAWGQYRQMLHTSGIEWEFIPCFSVLLRIWFSQGAIWLQYVPASLGCAWALAWFWRRRATWDWIVDGSLLMLVSIVVAPYSWLFDQCLAIPALLRGAYLTRFRSLLVTLALLSSLIELAMFGNLLKPSAVYLWTLWAAPGWLAWYLVVLIAERWSADWPRLRATDWLRRRSAVDGAADSAQTVEVPAGSNSLEA